MQLQYKSETTWTDCFSLTPTDSVPLKMPNAAFLGFSAETGELSDNFDIVSVETRNLYSPGGTGRADARSGRGRASKAPKKSGGWGWFFVKTLIFIVVVAGGYVGYTTWRTNNRKRF